MQTSFTATNITLDDVYFEDGTTLMKVSSFSDIVIDGLTATKVRSQSSDDGDSRLIDLSELATTIDSTCVISNVNIQESGVTVLQVSNSNQLKSISQSITVSNVVVSNSYFEFSDDLFVTGSVRSNNQFTMIFTNVTFSNIEFDKGGNLFLLQHQSPDQFLIQHITVTNVTSGGIDVSVFDQNSLNNKVRIQISNMTAHNIDSKFRSFIQINQGADLEIRNSTFYAMSNLESGAVLFAGNRRAIANIHDSKFFNITSVEGAVFTVEDESVVR